MSKRSAKTYLIEVDQQAYLCLVAVYERTGIPMLSLTSHMVCDWYDLSGDAPAGHIRWCIREEQKAARREARLRKRQGQGVPFASLIGSGDGQTAQELGVRLD